MSFKQIEPRAQSRIVTTSAVQKSGALGCVGFLNRRCEQEFFQTVLCFFHFTAQRDIAIFSFASAAAISSKEGACHAHA